ncbi:MAG: hypothetical protein L0Y72_21415 [Gemmataceae bacterium]|nr:hypothetical protein [Gemmataceae bacterium]MCI0741603.1 hypothetical protein [Gemmataceae bacterium]
MGLHQRIDRLERAVGIVSDVPQIQRAVDDVTALRTWLADRGFPDAQAAVAAGERGPSGLAVDLFVLAAVEIEVERRMGERVEVAGPVPIRVIEFVQPEEAAKYRALSLEDKLTLRRIRAKMDGQVPPELPSDEADTPDHEGEL